MKIRVLAIDDSRTIREMLKHALIQAGFDVHVAEDGLDGLNKLASVNPDVVITDINMPKVDGFGVIAAIRENHQYTGMPILVLTTESAEELKERARNIGATGWIVKPFDDGRLIGAIRRVALA